MQQSLGLTVSQLNQMTRQCLEQSLGTVWVEGEITGLARPKSGHCYFSLKDSQAQVRCAAFRQIKPSTKLSNGDQVHVKARVSLFAPRGDYQLIVEAIETLGAGDLHALYQQRWHILQQAGLFDPQRKRPLPLLINTIGLITSPTGAAVQDVLSVLARRFSPLQVIIYPSLVQGEQAAQQLCQALARANQRQECHVLLMVRGGGSPEDLWAFNDEQLVRAVAHSALPIITGVGHETDTTLVDFASDQRAATPSAAAELVSPDRQHYQQRLDHIQNQLIRVINRTLLDHQQRLDWLQQRHGSYHPKRQLATQQQRLENAQSRLLAHHPKRQLHYQQRLLQGLAHDMQQAISHVLQQAHQRLATNQQTLEALSPLAVLQRGYSHVTDDQGHTVQAAHQLTLGQTLTLRFAQGHAQCHITKLLP